MRDNSKDAPEDRAPTVSISKFQWDHVQNELKAARAEISRLSDSVAEGLSKAIELLHRFSDHEDQSCSFDHHGTCQEHNSGPPCAIAESRAFLALTQSPRETE